MSELDSRHLSLTTLGVVPAPLTLTSSTSSVGPEVRYLEEDVRFFQLWTLAADLALNVTVLAAFKLDSEKAFRPKLNITAPTIKLTQSLRPQGPRVVKDAFIVADRLNDEVFIGHEQRLLDNQMHSVNRKDRDDLRFRLNWKAIFQHVFGPSHIRTEDVDDEDGESAEDRGDKLREFLRRARSYVQEAIRDQTLNNSTL